MAALLSGDPDGATEGVGDRERAVGRRRGFGLFRTMLLRRLYDAQRPGGGAATAAAAAAAAAAALAVPRRVPACRPRRPAAAAAAAATAPSHSGVLFPDPTVRGHREHLLVLPDLVFDGLLTVGVHTRGRWALLVDVMTLLAWTGFGDLHAEWRTCQNPSWPALPCSCGAPLGGSPAIVRLAAKLRCLHLPADAGGDGGGGGRGPPPLPAADLVRAPADPPPAGWAAYDAVLSGGLPSSLHTAAAPRRLVAMAAAHPDLVRCLLTVAPSVVTTPVRMRRRTVVAAAAAAAPAWFAQRAAGLAAYARSDAVRGCKGRIVAMLDALAADAAGAGGGDGGRAGSVP